MTTVTEAKNALDCLIKKGRVHQYKPIQVAEILRRKRVFNDINILEKDSYRKESKKWRDAVTQKLVGNVSTSSAKYQDNLFDENAIPPRILQVLSEENNKTKGSVEAYIYKMVGQRLNLLTSGVDYCLKHDKSNFKLKDFLELFWHEPGLKRSIDKVYECIVYALIASIVISIEAEITLSYNPNKKEIIEEFEDFTKAVLNISVSQAIFRTSGSVHRIGATNAADRGLDIWTNFGVIVQIKHLALTEHGAEKICNSVTADRIVIVCKKADKKIITSLLTQIGWKSRIQSIITEDKLILWYEKALRGKYSESLGSKLLELLIKEIYNEFPATENDSLVNFYDSRGYNLLLNDDIWLPKEKSILQEDL